jgi:hypothetical protein
MVTKWSEPHELRERIKQLEAELAECQEQVNDLKMQVHQAEYAIERSARFTELAVGLRDALPDVYVNHHIAQCVGSPESLMVAVIRGFETRRLWLYPGITNEWGAVLEAMAHLYETWCCKGKGSLEDAAVEMMVAYDKWLDARMTRGADARDTAS